MKRFSVFYSDWFFFFCFVVLGAVFISVSSFVTVDDTSFSFLRYNGFSLAEFYFYRYRWPEALALPAGADATMPLTSFLSGFFSEKSMLVLLWLLVCYRLFQQGQAMRSKVLYLLPFFGWWNGLLLIGCLQAITLPVVFFQREKSIGTIVLTLMGVFMLISLSPLLFFFIGGIKLLKALIFRNSLSWKQLLPLVMFVLASLAGFLTFFGIEILSQLWFLIDSAISGKIDSILDAQIFLSALFLAMIAVGLVGAFQKSQRFWMIGVYLFGMLVCNGVFQYGQKVGADFERVLGADLQKESRVHIAEPNSLKTLEPVLAANDSIYIRDLRIVPKLAREFLALGIPDQDDLTRYIRLTLDRMKNDPLLKMSGKTIILWVSEPEKPQGRWYFQLRKQLEKKNTVILVQH